MSLAIKAKGMIFISGYENKIYEQMLTKKLGWKTKVVEATTKSNKGKSIARKEIVWMNKYYLNALESGKVPIKLTDSELKQRKLNPERL
jgi:DNA adenine methylase|tara:strand:+ start:397 stop:663 length:267 start_codon:yes stop_codon:yes gene_type:complete